MDATTLASLAALLELNGLLAGTRNLSAATSDMLVTGADCDSRVVSPGHIFICKGAAFRPTYLTSALERGALAYVCDEARANELASVAPKTPALVVRDVRRAMALVSAAAWGHPDKNLTVIGITGTKGKSTVAYMLRAILDGERPGSATGLIGSINTYDGRTEIESVNTTPESPDLWRLVATMRESGLAYLDMEVSSQALKYDRVTGMEFDIGCFLNIGRDHISPVEHPSFEDYFASKLRLFDQTHTAVVNLDADHADEILARAKGCERIVTFSAAHDARADIWASDVRTPLGRIEFCAHTPAWDADISLGMPGLFNVDNALAAIAIACTLGIERDAIVSALGRARVPGRMELLVPDAPSGEQPRVIGLVDYAHNKLSYQGLFSSLSQELPGWRIVVVLGAPGGKAQERRHELPQEAARWANHLIFTEEDPAHEDPAGICAQMAAATPAGTSHEIVCEREAAIRRAVELAVASGEPTLVALLGKGDEALQHVGSAFVPYRTDGVIFWEALAACSDAEVFQAATSIVCGDVELGHQVNIWHGAVLRGDVDTIRIGSGSNIQDNATVHVSLGSPVIIGEGVTVGHNAVVHGCRIGDNTLIGMGAIVLDGAEVGSDCIIGAGALVTRNKHLPDGTLWLGSPARQVRCLREDEIAANRRNAEEYVQLARAAQRQNPNLWR